MMTPEALRSICAEHAIMVSLAGLVRESDVARLFGVNVRTLQNWRRDSCGPASIRMGGAWRYPIQGLAEFMTPADEARKGRKGAELPGSDDHVPSRDHAATPAQKVES
jgi:phage terminase Nu1 subunit (DNA packaging protein)